MDYSGFLRGILIVINTLENHEASQSVVYLVYFYIGRS